MQQGFFEGKTDFFHYVIAAEDTWIDIFSQEPPRVFCQYFGKHLEDRDLNQGYIFDAFYEYTWFHMDESWHLEEKNFGWKQ